MRNYYYYNSAERLPIDDPKLDNETAHKQMQRLLADKISNFAPIEELRLLLVSGAKADGIVTLGLRPLHYACYRNYFDAAKLLIVRGAKVDCVDDIGYSPLHLCAEKGNFRMLKLLIEHLVNRRRCVSFESQDTPYLVRDGADEPLRLAILQNHYECAKLLLESGADPNVNYFDGPQLTLLDPKDLPYIRLLLDYEANPNLPARNGITPLMRSCEEGILTFKTTKLLIEKGADVNYINFKPTYPMSVLHYAINSGHLQTVRLLLENGAQPNIREKVLGKTQSNSFPSALHFAIMSSDIEMVKLLLDFGADITVADSIYGNALHLATCYRIGTENQSQMIELLLSRGADPNANNVVNSHGTILRTPVHEFFRRLFKFSVESDRATEWIKIVTLLFAYGGQFFITPENLDTTGMSITMGEKKQPQYAQTLNYFIFQVAMGIENVDQIEENNCIYATRQQLQEFKTNPSTLAQLTRNFIRTQIKVTPQQIEHLPLPFFTKDYLLCATELPSAN